MRGPSPRVVAPDTLDQTRSAKAAKALKDAIAANPASAQRLKAEAAVLNMPAV